MAIGPTAFAAEKDSPPFRLVAPSFALQDVPLPSSQAIRITALTADGGVDQSSIADIKLEGVRITEHGQEVSIAPLKDGVLELKTDLTVGRKIYVIDDEIQLTHGDFSAIHPVRRVWSGWALLPPILAIGLAIWWKDVIAALFLAIFAGAIVLAGGDPFTGFLRTIDTHILRQLVPPDGGTAHGITLLFTLFLGAMIGVMSASGGTRALVNRLTRYARTRESGQITTWIMGLVVFFDDYANSLLVGGTMRSVSDRLKISREKLSFIVDSTAAPVAGLAVVSTWLSFELDQIRPAFEELAITDDVYLVFLSTIPYRFYPVLMLVFGFSIAFSGRDFGPMLRAEEQLNPGLDAGVPEAADDSPSGWTILNALFPLCVLLAGIITGLVLKIDSYPVLLWSSFGASLAAIASAVCLRSLTLVKSTTAWVRGAESMILALVILMLAWSIAGICDEGNLNTAGLVIESLGEDLSARWMPATAFLVAGAISFAIGSSFATMALLMGLFITVTYHLMLEIGIAPADVTSHPFMLGTIGAILAGAIFGDHCSPISDTTVLSSAASGCDHLAHVQTQMPYAFVVGGISLVVGYLPVAWGVSPYVTTPIAIGLLIAVLKVWGRRPVQSRS